MKRFWAAAAAVLVLSGCSAPPKATVDDYLKVVRAIPQLTEAPDDSLIKVGESTCTTLDATQDTGMNPGEAWDTVIGGFSDGGSVTVSQASVIVAAAIAVFCPEHDAVIPDDVRG